MPFSAVMRRAYVPAARVAAAQVERMRCVVAQVRVAVDFGAAGRNDRVAGALARVLASFFIRRRRRALAPAGHGASPDTAPLATTMPRPPAPGASPVPRPGHTTRTV
eukprot:gene8047-9935_t